LKAIQSTGFDSRFTNLGQTSNRGVEITLASRNIVKRNFGWSTEFTISHNNQMVDNVGHEEYVSVMDSGGYMMYGYKKGYPLNALWGFQYEGVFRSVDEIRKNPKMLKELKENPVPVIEKLVGMDLPDALVEQLIDGIKVKLAATKVGNALEGLGKLFGK
jgi:hypothetical protein